MPTAVAASLATNSARVPYLTVGEYQNAPTAVNYQNLIPQGTTAQNDAELANIIARASSWIDGFCHQVLAATSDIDPVRRFRINRDGLLIVPLRFTPVREVTAISLGPSPSTMSDLSTTAWPDVSVGLKSIEIPAWASVLPSNEFMSLTIGSRVLVQVSYINGYPNTTLTSAVDAATSLQLADTTGVLAGDTLTVYDDTDGIQNVTVGAGWTPATGPGTIPVTPAVTAQSGMPVSALPPAVKQAAIFATTSLLKARGSASIQMASTTTPGTQTPSDPAGPDLAQAKAILTDGGYKRVR